MLMSYIMAGKICSYPLSDSISNPLSQKQATTTVVSGISNEERVTLTALYGPNKPKKGKRGIFWIHFKPCWKKDDSNLFFGYEAGTLIIWEYSEFVSELSKDSSKTESLKRIGEGGSYGSQSHPLRLRSRPARCSASSGGYTSASSCTWTVRTGRCTSLKEPRSFSNKCDGNYTTNTNNNANSHNNNNNKQYK